MPDHASLSTLTQPADRRAALALCDRPFVRRIVGVILVGYWLTLFTLTHIPRTPAIGRGGVDKWMHFGAYAGLGFLMALAVRKASGLKLVLLCVVVATAYGAFDELTQPIVGRDCELFDWLADIAGAAIGALAGVLAYRLVGGHVRSVSP